MTRRPNRGLLISKYQRLGPLCGAPFVLPVGGLTKKGAVKGWQLAKTHKVEDLGCRKIAFIGFGPLFDLLLRGKLECIQDSGSRNAIHAKARLLLQGTLP